MSGDGSLGIDVAQIDSDAAALSRTYNATDNGASTYTLTVTDAAQSLTTAFDALAIKTHVTAVVVSDSAQHYVTLSVASALADTSAEAELYQEDTTTPADIAVSDLASAISANFDALNSNSHVNSIIVADAGAISLSTTQFGADSNAIGELLGSYQLSVSGVAASFNGTILGALQANGHVGSIIVSDSQEISVTVAQLGADSTALGLLHNANQSVGHVLVSDTAANIQGVLGALNAYPFVNKIVVTDSVSNEVTISVAMTSADPIALGELYAFDGTSAASSAVSDTASAISFGFGSLNADVSVDRIIVADSSSQQVILSAAAAVADTRAEGELYRSNNATAALVAVSDVASELSNHLDSLNANVHVGPIIILDPGNALTLLAAQVADDARALGAISPSYTIAVTDSAANVAQYLDALDDNTSIGSITVNDSGSIDVSVSTFGRDQSAIAAMTRGSDGSEALVTVADTTANIGANLVNLTDFVSEIASLVLDDSGTLVISSVAALNADTSVIAKITSGYTLAISDSGGNMTGAVLDTLETYATGGHVESLTVDGGAAIAITVAEITSDHDVLALTANGDGSAYTLAVADTAANVAATLNMLAQNSHVDTIELSEPATVMTITDTQYTSDSALFAEFTTDYRLDVTGVAAANAVAVLGDAHVRSIAVSDSGANVKASLDALESQSASIGSVSLTDTSAPTVSVTYAQLTSDAAILSEVGVAFNLAVTNVGAGEASGVAALVAGLNNSNVALTTISVVDSSTNVQSSFDALNGVAASIVAVTFTDNSPTISLSDTEYNSSSVLRAAFQGSYSLDVDSLATNATSIAADPHVSSIEVVGSSLEVQANFTDLNGVSAKIAQVVFTDSSEPTLTISGAQYDASALLRSRLNGPYEINITDVAISDVATVDSDFLLLPPKYRTRSRCLIAQR